MKEHGHFYGFDHCYFRVSDFCYIGHVLEKHCDLHGNGKCLPCASEKKVELIELLKGSTEIDNWVEKNRQRIDGMVEACSCQEKNGKYTDTASSSAGAGMKTGLE